MKRAVLVVCSLTGLLRAESLTLPPDQRPEWLSRDGIVMAGSWEPLPFRVRRDGAANYTPTADQLAAYGREHSPEMVEQLKALGVNFVMMHCYKGGGLKAERQSMQDAVQFSRLCHDAGLRVGVYNYSGAFIWETFFEELPAARDWLLLDADGKPLPYSTHYWRYFWNRNHPDAQAFYRGLIRFAVRDIQTDLVHFDNHDVGPGADPVSAARFREYLGRRFSPEQRRAMGINDLQAVLPPLKTAATDPLRRAWADFAAQSLADAYIEMSRYARTLRKDILMECNPGGPGEGIHAPVDHGRLLAGGEAFWDEGRESGYQEGRLQTRIRTYKVGRRLGNIAFAYTTTPLEAAESMAFNLDSLGCICWFEYGRIVSKPASEKPVSPDLAPYVRFFHARRDLLRNAEVISDIAVLRSFASQTFGDSRLKALTGRVEQALIIDRLPFQILYDGLLPEITRYRVLVLAGAAALSDAQVQQVRRFVQEGGRLCIVGAAATHDEWMNPRTGPALDGLDPQRVRAIGEDGDVVQAVRDLAGDSLSITVEAPAGVCMELTRQADRRLVHLVNYRTERPAANVSVRLRVPEGRQATRVTLVVPGAAADETVPFSQEGAVVTFRVPRVAVYAIAIAE
jgi:hypothetical protein